jgi:hypothetical protein
MSQREQIAKSISIENHLKLQIAELEKAKYGALIKNVELRKEILALKSENKNLSQLLQNSRVE